MSMIPAGTYRARPVQQDTEDGPAYAIFGQSPQKGSMQVAVRFQFVGGELEGEQMTWIGSFTGGAAEITAKALRACGLRGNDVTAAATQELTNEVELVVKHEEYEGKTRARVAFVNALGGGFAMKKADNGALARLKAEMQAKLKGIAETTPAPAPVTNGKGAQSAASVDDPFA